ncbi:MAG: DUF1127 domain-containing protein [Pseudomonadota bacterium]
MAAIDTTRTDATTGGFFKPVLGAFAAIAAWNDARTTRNALSGLSNRELSDIGMVKADIDDIISRHL